MTEFITVTIRVPREFANEGMVRGLRQHLDATRWSFIADAVARQTGVDFDPSSLKAHQFIVVTRYGHYRHISHASSRPPWPTSRDRYATLCVGTSAWRIEEWERVPDHPYLTPEQMKRLPMCPACIYMSGRGMD